MAVALLLLTYCICTFSCQSDVITTLYYKITKPTVSFENISSLQAASVTYCSQLSTLGSFNCFNFQKNLNVCELGTCAESNVIRSSDINLYSNCNFNDGFQLVYSGAFSACVWASNYGANYFDARDTCRSKGSYLYVMKSIEKLWILKDNYSWTMWIGLTDVVEEGQYRWEDDNSLLDLNAWRSLLFNPGEPNNDWNNEDCITFYMSYYSPLCNDKKCTDYFNFICERPIMLP